MSLYKKIGRLIKQNKLYEIYNSNSSNDSNIENIVSQILLTNNMESPVLSSISANILFNNNKFSKLDFEEALNLIKNCTPKTQLILIAILEIQLTLIGNENNYIKYEKINEKKIEKNIYWVITKEIHKRVHKEKNFNEFEEFCHCIHDQIEKNNLGTEYNFKYDNIDSIICELKFTHKNIEFIAIKTVFISLYNITFEYIQKYIEINEYNKKNNYCEYSIFEYIINDFVYINDKIKFIGIDFIQSLNNFKNLYNMNFSLEDLFKDIFFNALFHNKILSCQFIYGFTNSDNNIKNSLLKILNIISNNKIPLHKNISKILNIENLFSFKIDLSTKIIEKNEQLNTHFSEDSIEKEVVKLNDEEKDKNNEISFKKEVIYISGSFEKKENEKINIISKISKINMDKIFLDIEKNDIDSIPIPIFNNKNINNEKDKIYQNINENKNNIINNNNYNNSNDNHKNINNYNSSNEEIQNNNKNICDKKEKIEKMNMENKSLDEIYEYISKDNKVKNKKKNRKKNAKNKAKSKKNKEKIVENEYNETNINDNEDPIVVKFKNDINEKVIFANSIKKIKPLISEKWIKSISSY